MNRVVALIFVAVGGILVYRLRYQIMNNLLGNEFFRKTLVQISMRIPYVRRAFLNKVFR